MAKKRLRVALVINPVAGLGGCMALKGSDGDLARRARDLGARPHAGRRVSAALAELRDGVGDIDWCCASGPMGEEALRRLGAAPRLLHRASSPTSAEDTRLAAAAAADSGVDLLLFAGGDGTARDVLAGAGDRVPVLGIPAGVKMHSAVFAVTPRSAGTAARRFLQAGAPARFTAPREVMDRELTAAGEPASAPTLYGYLTTLQMPSLVQAAKAVTGGGGDGAVMAALPALAREMRTFDVALLGPGATLAALKRELGIEATLLGVDVLLADGVQIRDAREDQIWEVAQGRRVGLALGVIGGQGFLLGRGNQQLSARILRLIPRDDFRIIASAEKLIALPGSRLLVDTGDDAVDRMLCGYLPVITGPRRRTVCPVVVGAADDDRKTQPQATEAPGA
ncbi:MAG: NAD(+)/NADH kinase [Halieaceae bacterium]|jgi:predicted polyphosphate/ATP-dependent NAD kinase|nr:NAD(+)/NADH kinase [Halieaceae bacterium]